MNFNVLKFKFQVMEAQLGVVSTEDTNNNLKSTKRYYQKI